MKTLLRALPITGLALVLGADALWAHPGHHALSDVVAWVGHALASPYHLGWIAVAALGVAWGMWRRGARRALRDR